jgi:peptide/nickel transport system permease protein
VAVAAFLLVRLIPGDPVIGIFGNRGSPEARAALRAELNLDRPLLEQFQVYFGDLLQGDLGRSIVRDDQSVSEIIKDSLPVTLSLVFATMLLSIAVGIPLGCWAALTSRKAVDHAVRGLAIGLLAIPPFFLALLLLLFLPGKLHALPAGGWGEGWPDNLRYLVLPSIALSAIIVPQLIRTVRQSTLDAAGQQFVDAAIVRGVRARAIVVRHILPNSLLPVITLLGLNLGALVGGAVVVEALFATPGIGTELAYAVGVRDYPVIQGIALVTALFVVFGNLLADILNVIVDPRTRRA